MRRIKLSPLYFRALRRDGKIKAWLWTTENLSQIETERVFVYSKNKRESGICDCILLADIIHAQKRLPHSVEDKCWEVTLRYDCEVLDL